VKIEDDERGGRKTHTQKPWASSPEELPRIRPELDLEAAAAVAEAAVGVLQFQAFLLELQRFQVEVKFVLQGWEGREPKERRRRRTLELVELDLDLRVRDGGG